MKRETFVPLGNRNDSFQIHEEGVDRNLFYQLKAPYQATYVTCSGSSEEDYLNNLTLSENGAYYLRETFSSRDLIYRTQPEHFHDFYELMIVLEGAVTQRIEGQEYRYPAGSCCLLSRGLCHNEGFTERTRLFFLGFSEDFLAQLFASAKASPFPEEASFFESDLYRFMEEGLRRPDRRTYLDMIPTWKNSDPYNRIHLIAELLMEFLLRPRFGTSVMARGLLSDILSLLADPKNYHCSSGQSQMKNDTLLFSRIARLMEERSGRVSRQELSEALNYSGDYLCRIIKKYSGESLYDYGMTFCMKSAAEKLLRTTASIAEISEELGFTNRTQFYKLFRKQYGITPKEYRAQRGTGNQGRVSATA